MSDPCPPETLPLRIEDGVEAGAWLHRAVDPAAPVLVVVPALGTPAGAYRRLGEAAAASGLNLLRADLRGNGSSNLRARRGVDWGYLDLVDADIRAMLALASQALPDAPRILLGHSLGGQAALLHQARHPDQAVQEVALVASAAPWWRRYGASGPFIRGFAGLARLMADRLGVFRGDWVRFGGPQGARLMREWAHFTRTGALPPLGAERWDPMPALAALRRPIHALCMGGDLYAPPAAVHHLAGLTGGPFSYERVERLDDGRRPAHFRWLKRPEAVVQRLVARYRLIP